MLKKRKGHRILCVLMGAIMILSAFDMASCGGGDTTTTTSTTSSTTSSSTGTSTTTSTSTTTTSSTAGGSGGQTPDPDDWRSHPEDFKLIAFTFDDTPGTGDFENSHGKYLVDLFAQYDGAATFFLIGSYLTSNGYDIPAYALQHGWDLGNHTKTHCSATTAENAADKYERYRREITDLNDMVKSALNYDIFWFRPPNMDRGQGDWIFEVTTELGMPVVGETKYSYDWSANHDAEAVKNAILTGTTDGEIVLLHSENEKTYTVIAEVLEELYNDGFRFVTLTELFTMRGRELDSIPCNSVIKSLSSVPRPIRPIKPKES